VVVGGDVCASWPASTAVTAGQSGNSRRCSRPMRSPARAMVVTACFRIVLAMPVELLSSLALGYTSQLLES